MNIPAIVSAVAAVNCLAIAALASKLSTAPAWPHKRVFALATLCAAVYCICDILTFADLSLASLVFAMRVQGAAATMNVAFLIVYALDHLRIERPRARRAIVAAFGLAAALWLVPGCMLRQAWFTYDVSWLGVAYKVQVTTLLGSLTLAADIVLLLVPITLYARARKDVAGAALHAIGFGVVFACAVSDAIVAELHLQAPFVLTAGFLASTTLVGMSVTTSFVRSARELDAMAKKLEETVDERTRKLLAAEANLVRAEKLVAIGKLSAGIAHEINNPSAAIAANLEYLRGSLAAGTLPSDALECLDESSAAIQRITNVVRQLLDSSRAESASDTGSASVSRAIDQALATVRPQLPDRVKVDVEVPGTLFARGDESSLVQVLVNLLLNGAQAIPQQQEVARLAVRAHGDAEHVTLEVQDNGTGIPENVRPRLFEPFFTTKPFGEGTGLGLAVSLGLVRSMGGEIEVQSSSGGTTMRVRLASERPPSSTRIDAAQPARPQLLLVDDDSSIRNALVRSLSRTFEVTTAESVHEALAKVAVRSFDIVLSDWKMPGGGGRELYLELATRHPEIARRVVFISGGALTDAEQAWLDAIGAKMLTKPLVLDELVAELGRIERLAEMS